MYTHTHTLHTLIHIEVSYAKKDSLFRAPFHLSLSSHCFASSKSRSVDRTLHTFVLKRRLERMRRALHTYAYVCMYVCMYVCVHVCNACEYLFVSIFISLVYVCTQILTYTPQWYILCGLHV